MRDKGKTFPPPPSVRREQLQEVTVEHHENAESHLEGIERIRDRYRMIEGTSWDAELAAEAAMELVDEEKGKEGRDLRELMGERFIDAFYPEGGFKASDFAERFIIEAPPIRDLEWRIIRDRSLGDSTAEVNTQEGARRLSQLRERDVDARLYGKDVLLDVATAGTYVMVPEHEVRLVGSSKFSCCQAVVGRSHDGRLCFAHVPGPGAWSLRDILGGLLEKFGAGDYALIAPKREMAEYRNEDEQKMTDKGNAIFEELANEHGIPLYQYDEVLPGSAKRPRVHDNLVITVGDGGIQARWARMQYTEDPLRPFDGPYSPRRIEQMLEDDIALDIAFDELTS